MAGKIPEEVTNDVWLFMFMVVLSESDPEVIKNMDEHYFAKLQPMVYRKFQLDCQKGGLI